MRGSLHAFFYLLLLVPFSPAQQTRSHGGMAMQHASIARGVLPSISRRARGRARGGPACSLVKPQLRGIVSGMLEAGLSLLGVLIGSDITSTGGSRTLGNSAGLGSFVRRVCCPSRVL